MLQLQPIKLSVGLVARSYWSSRDGSWSKFFPSQQSIITPVEMNVVAQRWVNMGSSSSVFNDSEIVHPPRLFIPPVRPMYPGMMVTVFSCILQGLGSRFHKWWFYPQMRGFFSVYLTSTQWIVFGAQRIDQSLYFLRLPAEQARSCSSDIVLSSLETYRDNQDLIAFLVLGGGAI